MILNNRRILLYLSIIFLLFFLLLSGCLHNFAGDRRSAVTSLILSLDGTKLISITEDNGYYHPREEGETGNPDFQIWNTSSGKIILKESASYYLPASFSPDGKYFVKGSWILGPSSLSKGKILEVASGKKIADFSDTFLTWSEDGRFFFTSFIDELERSKNITMWDAKTITKVKTTPISYGYECQIAISPDATKFASISGWEQKIIFVYNLSNEYETSIWKKDIIEDIYSHPVSEIKWTNKDEIKVFYDLNNNITLMVWNASNGELLSEIKSDNLSEFDGVLLSQNGENYIGFNRGNNYIKNFNSSSIGKTIRFNSSNSTVFAWSSKGNIIAMGNRSGIIEIRNSSTGELINILMTPLRKARNPGPAPSVAYLFVFFLLFVLLLKRKRI